MQQKYYKQKRANADSVNNLMRQQNISACPVLAKEQCIQRHDNVMLNYTLCKTLGVKSNNEHWYDHVTKSVEGSHEGKVTVLWNQV
jgi:hypothetical protein